MSADVSRVEYDTALARVQAKTCYLASRPDLKICAEGCESCRCVDLTLAALGLDEPPTERVSACTCPPMRRGACPACRRVMEVRNRPPTETPKADEPPTGAKDDAALIADCLRRHGVIPGRNPDGINDDVAKLVMLVDGLAASNRVLFDQCREPVVPPTEPPKACPTCDGRGVRCTWNSPMETCSACGGSGIDGGTAA